MFMLLSKLLIVRLIDGGVMNLNDLQIPKQEGQIVAFEVAWSEDVKSTLCAFLNTQGGRIYFGVREDGFVVGVDDAKAFQDAILSVLEDVISPDASQYCKTYTETVDTKTIVVAEVLATAKLPFYVVNDKEPQQSVCYIRRGIKNAVATEEECLALHQKAVYVPYEGRPAAMQTLTFNTLTTYFQKAKVDLKPEQFYAMGLTTRAGFYTQLGYWLSDQCDIQTKVGAFAGKDKTSAFGGIRTFTGCIVEQYVQILAYLNNRFGFAQQIAAFKVGHDGRREEVHDYPEAAVREALMHFFVHRDYSILASSSILCFSDRLELLSYGGLVEGVDVELLKMGAFVPQNPKLADIMMKLFDMAHLTIGMPLMVSSYKPLGMAPELKAFHRALLITLPKVTAHYDALNANEHRVVVFLRKVGDAKRPEIESHLQLSYGTTIQLIKTLMMKNVLEKVGDGPKTRYRLK